MAHPYHQPLPNLASALFSKQLLAQASEPRAPWLQIVAQALPLTHVIDAARAVMIDGAGLVAIAPQIGLLLAMAAVFLAIGASLFRWE